MSQQSSRNHMAYRGLAFLLIVLGFVVAAFGVGWFPTLLLVGAGLFWLMVIGFILDSSSDDAGPSSKT